MQQIPHPRPPEHVVDLGRPARTPLYRQLEARVRALTAELPAGAPIPSERELSASAGVSRTTVRKTIGRLVAEGVLNRAHGYGTYVAHPKIPQTVALHGFTSDIAHSGQRPGAQIIDQRLVPATALVSSELGIDEGASVVFLERLRLVDDVPFMLIRAYYRAELSALLRLREHESAWDVIGRKHGVHITSATQTIDLAALGPADARRLHEAAGSFAFRLSMVARDADGRPVEAVRALYRAQLTQFHMELGEQNIAGLDSREGALQHGSAP